MNDGLYDCGECPHYGGCVGHCGKRGHPMEVPALPASHTRLGDIKIHVGNTEDLPPGYYEGTLEATGKLGVYYFNPLALVQGPCEWDNWKPNRDVV